MARIGFHASHEQFPPSELLRPVRAAERVGFDAAMSSDHFKPWAEAQGQPGPAGPCLVLARAAMQATGLPFGIISAPRHRYHLIAQGAATMAET